MSKRKKRKSRELTVPAALTETGPSMAQMTAQYQADMQAASEQQAALEREERERTERVMKLARRIDTFHQNLIAKQTPAHRIAVDFGGGAIAQVSTELINYLVRLAGEWSHDGWTAKNVDILQGAPHFILGMGAYMGDMLTRKKGKLPSLKQEVWSEFAKLFSQLGFSNLVRAARVRYNDGHRKASDYDALVAEKKEIERRLSALQGKSEGP